MHQSGTAYRALLRIAAVLGATGLQAGALFAAGAVTTAEADGAGKVALEIVYFAEDDCINFRNVREGAPNGVEGPQRTLVVTVTLERGATHCGQKLRKLEHRIDIPDRADALSVDIFFVDEAGTLIRSQRPRIYRDTAEERECSATVASSARTPVAKC